MSAMPSAATKPTESYDVVVVGAGFAGMYMLHRLRGQGMTARVYEQGSRRRRHLVLEPLSRRALRRREHAIFRIRSPKSCSRSGTGASAMRRSPRF